MNSAAVEWLEEEFRKDHAALTKAIAVNLKFDLLTADEGHRAERILCSVHLPTAPMFSIKSDEFDSAAGWRPRQPGLFCVPPLDGWTPEAL